MKYVNGKYFDAITLNKTYRDNEPFPHNVLDDFVDKELLNNVIHEFPDLSTIEEKRSFNEPKQIKFGSIGFKNLSKAANQLISFFNNDIFLKYLQEVFRQFYSYQQLIA